MTRIRAFFASLRATWTKGPCPSWTEYLNAEQNR